MMCTREIHDMSQNAEEKFRSIFVKALGIAGTVDVRLVVPLPVGRQQNRDTIVDLFLFHL